MYAKQPDLWTLTNGLYLPTKARSAPAPASAPQRPYGPWPASDVPYGPHLSPTQKLTRGATDAFRKTAARVTPGLQGAKTLATGLMTGAPGSARAAGAAGIGAIKAGAKFLGPIHLATTAVGGILNAGNRMMKGENPVSAIGNAAYDTADFAAFGLLKPAVGLIQKGGEEAGKAFFGATPEQEINDAANALREAEEEGNVGKAVVARQKLQNAQAKAQAKAQGMNVDNQADYTQQLADARFDSSLAQQQRQSDMEFANSGRGLERDFDLQRRTANVLLNNAYYRDQWQAANARALTYANGEANARGQSINALAQAFSQRY